MLDRRRFLAASAGALACAPLHATLAGNIPMGINTYCLRAMRWRDLQLIDYADGLKMDAVFLQDSLDPEAMEPAHWRKVRDYVAEKQLHIETGTGAVLPRSAADFDASVRN